MGTQKDRRNRHRRRITIVSVAAIVAFALGATAVHAALDRDTTAATTPRAASTPSVTEPSVSGVTDEPPTPKPSPSDPATTPTPTAVPSPSADPYALADGVYPTYLRKVHVGAGTLTVDVVQLFTDTQARVAAREDGMTWQESRYLEIYVRNENDLLRTLAVTPGATITFADGCVAEDQHGGLEHLRKDSTPYTDAFYYELTVEDGSVVGVAQEYAIVGC
jgi:hypothetical protein